MTPILVGAISDQISDKQNQIDAKQKEISEETQVTERKALGAHVSSNYKAGPAGAPQRDDSFFLQALEGAHF